MSEVDLTRFRKEVIGPFTGQKFMIRRVRLKEFMTAIGGLPLPISGTVQQALSSLKERVEGGDAGTEDKITKFYCEKGVIEPKVWFGVETELPEGAIYYEDLGGDLDYLASEIINYSHDLTGVREYDKFFRGPGTGAVGPIGEEVRAEAVDTAANGDVPVP